ncbi:TonB-dependent receptor [Sphingomonas sp. ID1715]|uniref:TonB-dependent receptor n=1 Tax=Sphingomonas sp. ID1715 TaxID=1656898 RepID=UPI001488F091
MHAADRQQFDIQAGRPLGDALRSVALASGRNFVVSSDLVRGRSAPELKGRFTTEGAFERLLGGSGLQARLVGDAYVIVPVDRDDPIGRGEGTDIVVTGTRIRGQGPTGSRVTAIRRDEIDRSGYGTTQQLIQALPQNFSQGPNEATGNLSARDNANNAAAGSAINLRGLGSASTLVLFNGNRLALGGYTGAFTDISLIPSSVIERIEVLPDGASAIYGSDAVAGVVNIIPRTRFEGLETRVRLGTADGDRNEIQAGAIGGLSWGGGHAVIAYDYLETGRLRAADRRYATEDLRLFGGPDQRQRVASPGTILAGDRFYAIPAGQDGRALRPDQLVPDQVNLEDQWRFVDLLPRQVRHSAYLEVEQSLSDRLTLFAEGIFAHRRFSKAIYPSENLSPSEVTSANPFYVDPTGAGDPITVYYSFQRDLGPEADRGYAQSLGGAAGLRFDAGPWVIEARGSASQQRERSDRVNLLNRVRLAAALADPDPATAYNLFGDGPSTNPATIDRVRGRLSIGYRYSLLSAGLKADGPLFPLPAGEVRLAVGGEVRSEHFAVPYSFDDTVGFAPDLTPSGGFPPARHIGAGYAELAVPVTAPDMKVPLFHRFDLSAAVRIENYNDFGTTTNPRLGVRWEPVEGVTLRGTYGTSFRAPSFDNLRVGRSTHAVFAFRLPDPSAPGGSTQTILIRGNTPGIGPETATTWTLGTDLEPGFLRGLRLSATLYDIRYRDRIAAPSDLFSFLAQPDVYGGITTRNPSPVDVAAYFADPAFFNLSGATPASIGAVVDGRTQNLSSVHQRGIDMSAHFETSAFGGSLSLDGNGAIIDRIDQSITAGAPIVDVVGKIGSPVRSRWRGSAAWTRGGFSVATFINRTAGYDNNAVTPVQKVASWTTIDLSIGYAFPDTAGPLRGLRAQLSATNLFDSDPPYVQYSNGLFGIGFNPEASDPLGRVIAIQLVKSW